MLVVFEAHDGNRAADAGMQIVHVTHFNNLMWDNGITPSRVVEHGVLVPPDDPAAFDLDARVSSGGIDVAHPVTVSGRMDRRHVQGKVRGGGSLVEVHTSSGGIRIE